MPHLILITTLLLLTSTTAHATEPNTASILADFDHMTAYIARNYAGFTAKINQLNRPALDEHTTNIRTKLFNTPPNQQGNVLHEWLIFFNDHHLGIRLNESPPPGPGPAPTPAADPAQPKDTVESLSTPHTTATFTTAYAARQSPDPLEGIWQLQGGRYIVAVAPSTTNPTALDASIISATAQGWNPGDIKLRFHKPAEGSSQTLTDLWVADRSRRDSAVTILPGNNAFTLAGIGGVWTRLHPIPQSPNEPERFTPSSDFFLSKLSTKTLWLRVPNFQHANQPAIEALLTEYKDDLATTPNLIIDARENSGGQDFVYEPLLKLAYTRPIYSPGIEIFSTPDNIAALQLIADDPSRPEDNREQISATIARLKAHANTFVPFPERPFSVTTFPEVLDNPKRIAILIDHAGSSGEQFILDARQSRKVTLFGTSNTAGVLDYSNQVESPFPSNRFTLLYPISRSLRLPEEPYDNLGVPPDIRIPKDTQDPIAFTQSWLERQAD